MDKCCHILKDLYLCEQICHEVHLTLDKCYYILRGSDLCELSSGIVMWTSVIFEGVRFVLAKFGIIM